LIIITYVANLIKDYKIGMLSFYFADESVG